MQEKSDEPEAAGQERRPAHRLPHAHLLQPRKVCLRVLVCLRLLLGRVLQACAGCGDKEGALVMSGLDPQEAQAAQLPEQKAQGLQGVCRFCFFCVWRCEVPLRGDA